MIKITPYIAHDTVTLNVEGRIAGDGADTLRQECLAYFERGYQVVLDVSGVTFIDGVGTETVRSSLAKGASCNGCSKFVSELLAENDS